MRNDKVRGGFSVGLITGRIPRAVFALVIPLAALAQNAEAPPLLPGDRIANGAILEAHSARFRLMTMSGDSPAEIGTMDARLSRVVDDGEEILRLRTDVIMGGNAMSYEFDFDAATLGAVATRQDDPAGKLDVRFGGAGVDGSLAPRAGTAAEHVSTPLTGRIFEAGTVRYLLAALPIKIGYAAKLPSIDLHEMEPGWITVRVTGRGEPREVAGRELRAWVIEIDQLGGTQSRLWLVDEPPYWIRQELGDGSYWWELVSFEIS